ncbi:hypothetical protein ID866_1423 [Astraeus odoratus]|nr:hypothetical protein ID866_1423 [Astraeus odoratus]
MPAIVCTAKASYKKQPGTLELTDTHLQWTQDGKKAAAVRIPYQDAASLFCSKEGAAQIRLKLGLVNDDAGHNFTFISEPPTVALSEREKFKSELTNIISRNRSGTNTTPLASGAPTPKPPVTAVASLSPSKPGTPAAAPPSRASISRATSVASDGRSPIIPGADAASDFRLRKKVLMSNPDLLALHRDLVMTGQITESEFWEGRELSEAEFWKRYFQSKLFNAHRASIRSSATQHVVKDDQIFDKYLEKDDDELEPRRPRSEVADLYINLGATLEDHTETGNEKDVTMQAGRQRGALPLIRKFNDHSERLLNSALGDNPSKRRRTDSDGQANFSQIELQDLRDSESSAGILLEMQDRQRYFEGQLGRGMAAEQVPQKPVNALGAFEELRRGLEGWESRFSKLHIERKASDTALMSMTQNVAARLDTKARKNDFSTALFCQLTTCQTAANEFLRQFWSAMYPPLIDGPGVPSTPSLAQRAAKAAKMAGYLSGTREKVDALVRAAQAEGVDGTRVEVVMRPVLDAVEHALVFHRARTSAKIQPKVV